MKKQLRSPFYELLCFCLFLGLIGSPFSLNAQNTRKPDLVLKGTLTHADDETYRVVPFTVPSSAHRITVEFSYTGKEQGTTADLGLFGPEGFRGWSGGNKHSFTVSATDATPSYLAGPITPGTWNLVIGIPNIRAGIQSEYKANIYFDFDGKAEAQISAFSEAVRSGPAWYRGDLHMHTGHSDGSCKSQSGKSVPCPVFKTLEAASERKLDFIAVTDHNTTSHFDNLRELAPYFDNLLLLHGREVTTFHGHTNVYGTDQFVDFRVARGQVPDINALFKQVRELGGIASINHPSAPTGEKCLGCGWNPDPEADFRLVTAVEAINEKESAISFWETQLNRGFRLTGIGGSDNHHADNATREPGAVGIPTTAVYANELSERAILDGIRSGHVFIDVQGAGDRLLELTATNGAQKAAMGDVLPVASGSSVTFTLHVAGVSNGKVEIIQDGRPLDASFPNIDTADKTGSFTVHEDGKRHWIRVNVRSPQGDLLLVGNPVYMNF